MEIAATDASAHGPLIMAAMTPVQCSRRARQLAEMGRKSTLWRRRTVIDLAQRDVSSSAYGPSRHEGMNALRVGHVLARGGEAIDLERSILVVGLQEQVPAGQGGVGCGAQLECAPAMFGVG